jgi:hypothetical protein
MIKNKTEFDATKLEIDPDIEKKRRIVRLEKEALRYGYTIQKVA